MKKSKLKTIIKEVLEESIFGKMFHNETPEEKFKNKLYSELDGMGFESGGGGKTQYSEPEFRIFKANRDPKKNSIYKNEDFEVIVIVDLKKKTLSVYKRFTQNWKMDGWEKTWNIGENAEKNIPHFLKVIQLLIKHRGIIKHPTNGL